MPQKSKNLNIGPSSALEEELIRRKIAERLYKEYENPYRENPRRGYMQAKLDTGIGDSTRIPLNQIFHYEKMGSKQPGDIELHRDPRYLDLFPEKKRNNNIKITRK